MNRLLDISSQLFRRNGKTLAVATLALALADCSDHKPTGQVVAIVNNQEITAQDLNAEARGEGAGRAADPKILLQKVVARVLLAQDAHKRGLDRYPGYPSDVARMQQTFLAQKLVQSTVKPLTSPTPQQLNAFMEAHPFTFKNRERIDLTELQIQGSDAVKSVQGIDSLSALTARLKMLNSPVKQQDRTVDTAELPPPLAAKLLSEPTGELFYVQGPDVALAIVIKSRSPISAPEDQQAKLAARMLAEFTGQQQVNAQVEKLKGGAKITYQPRFAPPPQPAKPAAPIKADGAPG